MREESHLDDMRSAIRGDFERLAERRGEQDLLRVPDETPEPDTQVAGTEGDHHPLSELEDAPEVEERVAEESPRSWLDRLLGR